MARILGLETEYGLLVRPTSGTGRERLSPAEAGQLLFAPIEREHASSNAFLRNGGRIYLDVGSHPEYATPECLTPEQVVLADRAGDAILARLAQRAEADAADQGRPVEVRLFKNNVDAHGNSYGSHENYSLDRSTDLTRMAELLTPFLVTRLLLCGSGRWTPEGFVLSQRAEHLHDGLSSMTTRARPLINTRDEPLADPARFRRLHVLAGDSNLSEPTLRLRLAATAAVVDLAERTIAGERGLLPEQGLADPAAALRDLSRDPRAAVLTASGASMPGRRLLRDYLDAAEPLLAAEATHQWRRVLDGIDDDDLVGLAPEVEWAAKHLLLESYRERHRLGWADRRLAQLDLAFHDITIGPSGPRGLFRLLESRGAARRLTTDAAVAEATESPPAPTRALLRSRLIRAAQSAGRRYTTDWVAFAAHDLPEPGGRRGEATIRLGDPFAVDSAAVEELLAALRLGWHPPTQG